MAGSLAQLDHPFLEHGRRHHLADAVVARGEIRRAEYAELLDEVGEAATIDHDGNGRAGAGLLQHVLVGAELRIGEQLDFDRAVRALGHRVAEAFQPLVEGISGGQRRVDAERGRGKSGAAQQDHGGRCRRAQSMAIRFSMIPPMKSGDGSALCRRRPAAKVLGSLVRDGVDRCEHRAHVSLHRRCGAITVAFEHMADDLLVLLEIVRSQRRSSSDSTRTRSSCALTSSTACQTRGLPAIATRARCSESSRARNCA